MTPERYKGASLLDKVIMMGFPLLHVVLFSSFFLYGLLRKEEFPLPVLLQLTAYFLTSCTYSYGIFSFHFSRPDTNRLIHMVNQKNHALLQRPGNHIHRSMSNRIFRMVAIFASVWTLFGISSCLPVVIEMFTSGEIFFQTPFPVDETPHGIQAIVQNTLQALAIYHLAAFFSLFWCIFLEIYLRLAWFFRVLADDLRGLGGEDLQGEEERLKALLKEYQELKACVSFANRIISIYLNAFVTLVYATMGGDSLIVRIEEGSAAPKAGDTIHVTPRENRLHWFHAETGKRL